VIIKEPLWAPWLRVNLGIEGRKPGNIAHLKRIHRAHLKGSRGVIGGPKVRRAKKG